MLKKIKNKAENWVSEQRNYLNTRKFRRLTMCKKCFTFYYKNSWHFERPDYIDENPDQEVPVRFTECPACLEQELAFYDME